jgi:hypothetical protein
MNSDSYRQKTSLGAYIVGLLGAFLIVALLVRLMQSYTQAPSISATRAAERMQILSDFKAANAPLLDPMKYDWQDQPKGFVRIPIERAKELVLEQWQDPLTARSNLMARAAKAFALPPRPPEKKNIYE